MDDYFKGWSIAQILQFGFVWVNTKEGQLFWEKVREYFEPEYRNIGVPSNYQRGNYNEKKALTELFYILENFPFRTNFEELLWEFLGLKLETL